MISDMDDELTANFSATVRGQKFTATAIGGRPKDAGAARDWGAGELVVPFVEIVSGVAFDAGTSFKIDIIGDVDATLVTGAAVVLSTITILNAAYTGITTGKLFAMPALLPGFTKRFLGCKFTTGGGNATQGSLVVRLQQKDSRAQSWGSATAV